MRWILDSGVESVHADATNAFHQGFEQVAISAEAHDGIVPEEDPQQLQAYGVLDKATFAEWDLDNVERLREMAKLLLDGEQVEWESTSP